MPVHRYFPAGHGHSIQAKNTTKDGAEFLLIFDSGSFSEESTFLLTDWLSHVPKEVIAKNFQMDISAFDHIPDHELYLFKGCYIFSQCRGRCFNNVVHLATPPPDDVEKDKVIPNNSPEAYSYAFSKVEGTKTPGGSIKYADTRNFNASKTISAAEVTVEVGGMRYVSYYCSLRLLTSFFRRRELHVCIDILPY